MMAKFIALALVGLSGAMGQLSSITEMAARANSTLSYTLGPPGSAALNNAAGEVFAMDVSANPVLATLPGDGISMNLGMLKPCGVLLPHVHPRASELYFVISGNVQYGLAEENGGRNLVYNLTTGQVGIAPQGLVHFMANLGCATVNFTQGFSNRDPGTSTISNALSLFNPEVLAAAQTTAVTSADGVFALDPACLQRCGLASAPTSAALG
jgi:mannose-6-phosphate isomerase-like protein (cupin superfamily)